MIKIVHAILCVALACIIAACAAIQINEKDEATLLAVKFTAKRIGYAVAQNTPKQTADMIAYAEILSNAGDATKLINEALPLALDKLDGYARANDPLMQSDIADLVALIKLKLPDVDIATKSKLAKAAITGFIEGCKLASK